MNKIGSCIWLNDQAEEASKFYAGVFKHVKIGATTRYNESSAKVAKRPVDSVLTVSIKIEDHEIELLNGGPLFEITPALSYFVVCEDEAEIDFLWSKLSSGGKALMGLDAYPWAKKYGWIADRFGVTWQLMLPKDPAPITQKISPAFLFVTELYGKGEEALNFYTSIFENSKVEALAHDPASKTIMHASFKLADQTFKLMEGAGEHKVKFNNAVSIVVNCDTQQELDHLWSRLTEGGAIEECGWLRDKFGVSWQIIPKIFTELMRDPRRSELATAQMFKMKKLDFAPFEKIRSES